MGERTRVLDNPDEPDRHAADRHELMCSYDDCRGRLHHLLDDAHSLREAAGEVLSASGFKDKLTHEDLSPLRRAVRRYDRSAAT